MSCVVFWIAIPCSVRANSDFLSWWLFLPLVKAKQKRNDCQAKGDRLNEHLHLKQGIQEVDLLTASPSLTRKTTRKPVG